MREGEEEVWRKRGRREQKKGGREGRKEGGGNDKVKIKRREIH